MKIENAVTCRIDELQDLWEAFKTHENARICRWAVGSEESALVDAFFQVNVADDENTPDIFLRFDAPFKDISTYGQGLSTELSEYVRNEREALLESGVDILWEPSHQEAPDNPALGFLRDFFHFALSLGLDEDELVVAFLAPKPLDNLTEWATWWQYAAALDLPPQIRLMVCDNLESPMLGKMAQQHPEKVVTHQPPLDSRAVVRELMSEFGEQDDNCTHFRKAFFELTQQIGHRDAVGIQYAASHALNLAQLIGFPHLEVSVLMAAGNGFATAGQLETGLRTLDEARCIAKAAEPLPLFKDLPDLPELDLPGGNIFAQLSVQALFFKAAALIGQGDFGRALENYQMAAAELTNMVSSTPSSTQPAGFTDGAIPLFHLTEAYRMSGYCLERLRRPQDALASYAKALSVGERMNEEARNGTMLAFAGQAMLDICWAQGMKQEYHALFVRMDLLLGEGWQKKLPHRQKG